MFWILIIVLPAVALMGCAALWRRNDAVFAARAAAIREAARRIEAEPVGADWTRHYAPLRETSYSEMVWKFWRPVSSFLTDLR